MRQVNKAGVDLIKEFEGFFSKPYLCPAKIPTIGFGSTHYEDGTKVTLNDPPITMERAEQLTAHELSTIGIAVEKLVKVPINDNQFSALCSFAYNVGTGNLSSSTLLKKLNAVDYQGASEQFIRWNKAGGKVLNGLTRRREAEQDLFSLQG
jgi:lysozyme